MKNIISHRLKKIREEQNKTQQKVSDDTGISKAYISELESGKRSNPSIDKLKTLARYYEVSLEYLTGDSNIKDKSINIPEGVAEFLNTGEEQFIQESLEKENVKMLLRETKDMTDKDIATAISLIKAYKDNK